MTVRKSKFVPRDFDGQVPIELEDAMPLLSFLLSFVKNYKYCIVAALETSLASYQLKMVDGA
jgi:hypothetical protein